ncbi:unnamed protein product [Xylocopa violacea]|uniref:Uncharacterized protein n=1 Tax=Xylocopa violacea TaxID=135666 RepID=A0ABP1N3B9_XYLVO
MIEKARDKKVLLPSGFLSTLSNVTITLSHTVLITADTNLKYVLRYTFHRRFIVCISLLGHRGNSRRGAVPSQSALRLRSLIGKKKFSRRFPAPNRNRFSINEYALNGIPFRLTCWACFPIGTEQRGRGTRIVYLINTALILSIWLLSQRQLFNSLID